MFVGTDIAMGTLIWHLTSIAVLLITQITYISEGSTCVDTYDNGRRGRSSSGTRQTDVTTLDECKARCIFTPNCNAIDWSSGQRRCYVHTGTNYLNTYSSSDSSYMQYRREPGCAGCDDYLLLYSKRSSSDGEYKPNYNDVQVCQYECLLDTSCTGVDFNNNNQCFFFKDKNFYNSSSYTSQVNQYRRTECIGGCLDTFSKKSNRRSSGGVQQESYIDSNAKCEARCLDIDECKAYDYDRTYKRCYIHWGDGYKDNIGTNNNRDQYTRVPCARVCQEYEHHPNKGSIGGSESPGGNDDTPEKCKDACTKDSQCVAVDFNTDNKKCYIHTNQANVDRAGDSRNVDQYRKIECEEECVPGKDKYSEYEDTSSSGGSELVPKSDTDTIEKCKEACSNNDDCLAVDFNTGTDSCYMHKNEDYIGKAREMSGVNQYRRTKCEVECVDEFSEHYGMSSEGGSMQTGDVNTEEKCIDACLEDDKCNAVDFNWKEGTCYHHEEGFASTATLANYVNQFRRKSCKDCQDNYEVLDDKYSTEGQQQSTSINTLEECKTECNNDADCKALDFNNDNRCYLHIHNDFVKLRRSRSTSTQYVKRPCGVCKDTFTEVTKKSSSGSVSQSSSINTLRKCKDKCLEDLYCYAAEFNTRTDRCRLVFDEEFEEKRSTNNDVNQYVRHWCNYEDCIDTFETKTRTRAYNGVEYLGIETATACQEACLELWNDLQKCYAADFDSKQKRCWLHLDEHYDDTVDPSNDVTQYRRKRCKIEYRCVETFTRAPGMYTLGGVSKDDESGLTECQDSCRALDNCYGFDLNKNGNCYHHYQEDFADDAEKDNSGNVDQYRRVKCAECTDEYEKNSNRFASGGKKDSSARSATACKSLCNDDETCRAVDFNRQSDECFLHFKYTDEDKLGRSDETDHYKRLGCPEAVCAITFTVTEDVLMYNGTLQEGITKLSECENYCYANSDCLAFDYSRYLKQCHTHTTLDGVLDLTVEDVDHYRKDPCEDESATPAPTPVCEDRFQKISNFLAYGGTPRTDANTVNLCKEACLGDESCVSVDFSRTKKVCFMHFDEDNLKRENMHNVNVEDTDHYRRLPCWASTTVPTPAGCIDFFHKERNTIWHNGDQIMGVYEKNVCEDRCLSDSGCVGFDWDRKIYLCYFHYNEDDFDTSKGGTSESSSDVDHYRRADCNTETRAPTPSSAPHTVVPIIWITAALLIFVQVQTAS